MHVWLIALSSHHVTSHLWMLHSRNNFSLWKMRSTQLKLRPWVPSSVNMDYLMNWRTVLLLYPEHRVNYLISFVLTVNVHHKLSWHCFSTQPVTCSVTSLLTKTFISVFVISDWHQCSHLHQSIDCFKMSHETPPGLNCVILRLWFESWWYECCDCVILNHLTFAKTSVYRLSLLWTPQGVLEGNSW